MPAQRKAVNPFFVLLTVVGVLFVITAAAYGVMTVAQIEPAGAGDQPHPLIDFMDQNGLTLMIIELTILAVATFAAIGTDGYWSRSSDHQQTPPVQNTSETETTS
jgi:flagellar basal body-associated protein FliL